MVSLGSRPLSVWIILYVGIGRGSVQTSASGDKARLTLDLNMTAYDLLNPLNLPSLLSFKGVYIFLGCCSTLWLGKTLYECHRLAKSVDNLPGDKFLISGLVIPRLLPAIRWINRSNDHSWKVKHSGKYICRIRLFIFSPFGSLSLLYLSSLSPYQRPKTGP